MLNEKLKKLRKEKGITQSELAKIVGVSTSMIGMYETDARKPSYEVLTKIAQYFRVSTDYLLGKTEYTTVDEKIDVELGGDESNQIKEKTTLYKTDEFKTAEDAIQFILKQNIIMSDLNLENMSGEDKINFAKELMQLMKIIAPKYKK